ncbi:MAG: DUF1353 domain-containing protein [Planctomycetota bacterium]|jgi:hypothetical protein
MSIFTENLIVSPLPDGKTWVSRKAFSYDVGEEGSGETIKVPAGFITDFASVPRLFWAFFPTWGKYGNAAVIHDYLYWEQSYPRERADGIFLEGMLVLGVEKGKAKLLYNAVKHFGKRAWGRNKKAKKKGVKKFIDITDEIIEIPKMELKGFMPK